MYFCCDTVLINFYLLLISAPFHLRLIYMPLYQVLQIFDKDLSILAEILYHIALQLAYQNTILNPLFGIPVSSFLQTFCLTQLVIFVLPFYLLLLVVILFPSFLTTFLLSNL